MSWTQTRKVNVNVPCTPGYCLTYVQDVFGIPAKKPSAIADWNANTYNHANSVFPAGVAVPVWFTGRSGALKQYGHVAVRMADGSVWSCSHPTNKTPMHFASIQALNNYYSGQLIYLGWTEDVEEVVVAKEVTASQGGEMITSKGLEAVFLAYLGRKPDAGAVSHYVGKYAVDFVVDDVRKSAEAAQHAKNVTAQASQVVDLQKQIAALKASGGTSTDADKKLADLKAALNGVLK